MSDTKRALTELNKRLGDCFVAGEPFQITVDTRPDMYVDYEKHRYASYPLLRRRPHIVGEIAIVGFAGRVTERSDMLFDAYALGGPEPQHATLGFHVDEPSLLLRAAQHVDLDPEQAKLFYFAPRV